MTVGISVGADENFATFSARTWLENLHACDPREWNQRPGMFLVTRLPAALSPLALWSRWRRSTGRIRRRWLGRIARELGESRLQLANPPRHRHDDRFQFANPRAKLGVLSLQLVDPIVSPVPHHEESSVEVPRAEARSTSHQLEREAIRNLPLSEHRSRFGGDGRAQGEARTRPRGGNPLFFQTMLRSHRVVRVMSTGERLRGIAGPNGGRSRDLRPIRADRHDATNVHAASEGELGTGAVRFACSNATGCVRSVDAGRRNDSASGRANRTVALF